MRAMTVNQFARLCGVDRNIAGQALRLFEKHGVVKVIDLKKVCRGRGRRSVIYAVPDRLVIDLNALAPPDIVGV